MSTRELKALTVMVVALTILAGVAVKSLGRGQTPPYCLTSHEQLVMTTVITPNGIRAVPATIAVCERLVVAEPGVKP